jgi:hypothetical protein
MRNYLSYLFGFSALIFLGLFFTSMYFPEKVDLTTWLIFTYFLGLTLAFHLGLVRSAKRRAQDFIRYYMASTTLKLLLHMGVIIIYSLFNKADAVRFIITFLIFYLLFTTFEVAVVWKKFRRT